MSLKLISSKKANQIITDSYTHSLEIEKEGIYLVEVTASTKAWWQNYRAKFRADKLKLQIGGEVFEQDAGKWNGNLLKGLSKTAVYILPLKIGCYFLRFLAENKPRLEEIKIYQVTDQKVTYRPLGNNPAQVGDCRPWYSLIFQGQLLQGLAIVASCKEKSKQTNPKDDDDLQLKIDGKIVNNNDNRVNKKHKYWFWCGDLLKGGTKSYIIEKNFTSGYHSLELNADRSPTIDVLYLNIAMPKTTELLPIVKPYKSLNGEDYNKYDEEIYNATKDWNDEFTKQKFPPPELLNPNLVKAIAYKESRVGNDINAGVDVMQVNRGDGALEILNNNSKYPTEYEAVTGKDIAIDYKGSARLGKPADSIYWGVRWLYHKAHGKIITGGDPLKPQWIDWKEAVKNYGPPASQEPEYANKIWNLYERGIDPHRKNNHLWTYTVLLFIGLIVSWQANSYFGAQEDFIPDTIVNYIREQGQVKGEDIETVEDNPHQKLRESVDMIMQKYPQPIGKNWDIFKPIVDSVKDKDFAYQWDFDSYLDSLVEKTTDLTQFVEAAGVLGILRERAWEIADFDGDLEKELFFIKEDVFDRNFLMLYLVDRDYDNHYQLIAYKLSDNYFESIDSNFSPDRPLMLFDIDRDFTPEILVFSSGGRYGANLTIFRYNSSAATLEQIFRFDNGTYYPEYIFTDQDNDDQLEIVVKNQSRGTEMYVVPLQETFEYNSERRRFELKETIE